MLLLLALILAQFPYYPPAPTGGGGAVSVLLYLFGAGGFVLTIFQLLHAARQKNRADAIAFLTTAVTKLEGRVETLERERNDLAEKLAEARTQVVVQTTRAEHYKKLSEDLQRHLDAAVSAATAPPLVPPHAP